MRHPIAVILTMVILGAGLRATGQSVNGTIWINDGDLVTNNKEAKVLVKIEANNADKMMLSTDPDFAGAQWEDYRPIVRAMQLSGGDGIKQVYARFKDQRGNVSSVVNAQIELDRQPPVGIEITAERSANHALALDLQIKAQGAVRMRLSNRKDFLGAYWVPFQENYGAWPVQAGDGLKTVYVQLEDKVGNKSETASASVKFDMIPPQEPSILINEGATFTTQDQVKVELSANGATQMMTSLDPKWQPYQKQITWDLSSKEDGQHEFKARFKDGANNETQWVKASIIMDRSIPTDPFILINNGAEFTTQENVDLQLKAIGAEEMLISNDPNFIGETWNPYQRHLYNWNLAPGDGAKTVYVKYRDIAGNESEVASDKVDLDISPPTGVSIYAKADHIHIISATESKLIADPKLPITLQIKADGATEMQVSHHRNFKDAIWQPFQNEIQWTLANTNDGVHYIYLKVRDKAGLESKPVVDNVFVDATPPTNCTMTIAQEDPYCTDKERKVRIKLMAKDANQMKIFNEGQVGDASWQQYDTEVIWQLSEEEGDKSIGVVFKDLVGNESAPVYAKIKLDNTPPIGAEITLDRGQEICNHPDKIVTINVQATDAILMQISNSETFDGSRWIQFSQANIEHTLDGEDGRKTVYARFTDQAGNISATISDEIILDRTPPTNCQVVINGGSHITNDQNNQVQLTIQANGATQMQIQNSPNFDDSSWEPYTNTKNWKLTSGDGQKAVYAIFKDAVGNKSAIAYDQIGLDTEAPKNGSITIDNGAAYTTDLDRNVLLSIKAHEATQMILSEASDFAGANWEPYRLLREDFALSKEDGPKTVYAKFKDQAGNETQPVSASIILDTKQPVIQNIMVEQGEVYSRSLDYTISVEMKIEDASEMIFSNDRNFKPPYRWEPFTEKKDWKLTSGDGRKRFFIKFRDKAGNESLTHENIIIVDTQAPVVRSVTLDQGSSTTESSEVTLQVDAVGAFEMQISNDRNFGGATWQPFLSSMIWTLSPGSGGRFVYVKLRDKAGNESSVASDFITVDL